MSATLSFVIVCEHPDKPGKHAIFRYDCPRKDAFAWCGRAAGWRKWCQSIEPLLRLYDSVDDASEVIDEAIKHPLHEEKECLKN